MVERKYIKDKNGKDVKDKEGHRLFTTNNAGEKDKVYKESKSLFGGSTKTDAKYDQTTKKWLKK